jgi:dUTP pyrophosphatase
LPCPEDFTIDNLTLYTINFKIKCEMINIETNELVSYYLYPRSSISNTGIILANSVGIIDAGYRGCIMAKIRKIDCTDSIFITKLTRLFQICAPDLGSIKIYIVNNLSSSTRGEGGFGSTGI